MEFVANALNKKFLKYLLPPAGSEIDGVFAAIAYGSNFPNEKEDFIADCVNNRYRLDLWVRYDHTVPVAPSLLRRILKHHKDNVFCKLIPDCLHSKVIWWKGYGAYIGSANLTDRAWNSNIEAGLFLSEDDLCSNGMIEELENFFDSLKNISESFPLTEEVIKELERIAASRSGIEDKGKDLRSTRIWQGPLFETKENADAKRKEAFRKEWLKTLTELRSIGDLLSKNRPSWVNEDIPVNWQVDQFLHAIYYNKIGEGRAKPYEDFYNRNKSNPSAAVLEMINWWKSTPNAPSHEDLTFYGSAPLIYDFLSKDKILTLNEEEFAKVCLSTHATKDHIVKMKLSTFGVSDTQSLPTEQRVVLFAPWLLNKRNKKGWNVLQLLNYVFYEGKDDDLWERLYKASKDDEYYFPHYGLNSIAELVGWTKPASFPPRNGRTSKALRALGYDVMVY